MTNIFFSISLEQISNGFGFAYTALTWLFYAIIIASAAVSVVSVFQSPKPSKISFGYVGDTGGSPRYGAFGPLDNTVSNELAVPVLYGQLKLAGNVIWQTDPGEIVSRVVGICEGEINDISDVRANDVVIGAGTPGSSYSVYKGTSAQGADSRIPSDLRPNLELHNTAYIALTLAASEAIKGGNPTITSVCQGLLVETWTGSIWNTTKVYSRNPAACIRDFIINERYGLGIPKANLDDDTFSETYEYCEAMVDVPSGGQEARYRLDYIMDSTRPAEDILNDMLATFGGFLVYAGNKIKLRVEKAELITQYFGDGSTTAQNATFDPGNIVKDSFTWNMPSMDERPNRLRVQWIDPDQNYVKVYTQVDDRIDQDDRMQVVPKEVSTIGITRATQASRIAKLMMSKIKYASVNIQFSARLESIQCEVGDVVALTHQASMYSRKLFRITNMQESENETISFTCSEYNASIYDDHQGSAVIVMQQPSGPNLYAALNDVTGFSALEDNFKNKDGVFVTNIITSWTAIPADQLLRIDHHLIQISSDGGTTYRDAAFVSGDKTSYRIVLGNVQTNTTFMIRIKTVSDRGAESSGATSLVTIQGKTTPPSNVEDFDIQFAFDHITMTWSSIDDEDLFGYEIRVGNSDSIWETAVIITSEALGTRYDLFDFTRGEKIFFIKAIDNSANYSEDAASDTINITSISGSNVVFTFDLFSRITQVPSPIQGTLSSDLDRIPTNDFNPSYNRIALIPKTVNTWAELQSSYAAWNDFQNSGFVFGREFYVTTEESYVTEVVDIGTITTGAYLMDIQTFSSSNLGFVSIQISTSEDNITYSSFTTFVSGQFTARYVKFKFLIQATNAETVVKLLSAILTIDVPDINQSILNQTIGAGGSTIALSGFISVKAIVITTVGTSNLIPRIHDQSNLPDFFEVKMFDTDGALQSGVVNMYISGY